MPDLDTADRVPTRDNSKKTNQKYFQSTFGSGDNQLSASNQASTNIGFGFFNFARYVVRGRVFNSVSTP